MTVGLEYGNEIAAGPPDRRLGPEVVGKHFELLKEVPPPPKISRVAVLQNPSNRVHAPTLRAAEGAARGLRVQLHVVRARTLAEIDATFAVMRSQRAAGVLVLRDTLFFPQRTQTVALTTKSGRLQ